MNKIFKVVWSKAKQCYVVVSEVAKNHSGKKKIVVASVLAALTVGSEIAVVHVQAAPNAPGTAVEGSVAWGVGSKATGTNTVGIGKDATATGSTAVAVGNNSTASNTETVALGNNTTASGIRAVSVGLNTTASGTDSIAMGYLSTASGLGSTAIGRNVNVSNEKSTAMGYDLTSTDTANTNIGYKSSVAANQAVSVGARNSVESSAQYSTALGYFVRAVGKNAVGIGSSGDGSTVNAIGNNSIAIGKSPNATGIGATAIGSESSATANDSLAIGSSAQASGDSAAAYGRGAVSSADSSTAIGRGAGASADNSTAVGRGASASAENSTAIGRGATVAGAGSVALGWNTEVTAADVATGSSANVKPYLLDASTVDTVNDAGNGIVAIGTRRDGSTGFARRLTGVAGGVNEYDAVNLKQLKALEAKSVQKFLSINGAANRTKANYPDKTWTIGSPATTAADGSTTAATTSNITIMGNYDNEGARGDNSVALGPWANGIGPRSVALGSNSVANGNQAIALGQSTFGHGENTLAVGSYATVNGENSIAIGTDTYVGKAERNGTGKAISSTGDKTTFAVAIGFSAKAYGGASTVIGKSAQSDIAHSVVLGEGSRAVEADATNGTAYLTGDTVNNSGNGVVSVGNTSGGSNITRRIVNVAGGTNDTDAVNVKQLKALENTSLKTLTINNGGTKTDLTPQARKLTLTAGNNVTLTPNAATGEVTISATGAINAINSGNANTLSVNNNNGTVTITPNTASNLSNTADANKLVTAGIVKSALDQKANASDLAAKANASDVTALTSRVTTVEGVANTAKSTADTAKTTAEAAKTAAAEAKAGLTAKIDTTAERHIKEGSYAVQNDGTVTLTKVDGAGTEKANEAVKITGLATKASVDTLTTKVGTVEGVANQAKATADTAKSTADGAATKATAASTKADAASTKATEAKTAAEAAKAGLADKADKSTVADLTTKVGTVEATANAAKAGLADKADKSTVANLTTKVGTVEATANAAKAGLADKVDKADFNNLKTAVDRKVDKASELHVKKGTYTVAADGSVTLTKVDGEGTEKTDEAVVINGFATKASVDNLTTEVGKKANASDVTVELAKKANAADVTVELAKKANAADVTAELAKKANVDDVTAELAKKANADDVTAELAKKVNAADLQNLTSDKVDKTAERHVKEGTYTVAADGSVTLTKVDGEGTEKADEAVVINGFATKASVDTLTTEVGKKANADDVTAELAKKADQTAVDALTTEVGKKADAATVTAELAKKANADDVTAELAKKANASDVEALTTEVGKKANADDVTAELAKKANADDVTAELAKKANASDVEALTTEVGKKADAATVNAALAKKADQTAVDAVKASLGDLSSNGRDGANGTSANKGLTAQDGLNGKTLADKVNALRNGEAGTLVYTDKDGHRLVKAKDGNYYRVEAVLSDGTVKPELELPEGIKPEKIEKPELRIVSPDGTTTPAKLSNVDNGTIAENSKDAVNGGQLFAANKKVADIIGTTVDANGQLVAPTFNVKDKDNNNTTTVAQAINLMNDKLGETKNLTDLSDAGKKVITDLVNVTGDNNIIVKPSVDEKTKVKTFTAKLNDTITLGAGDNAITVNGTNGTITAGNGDNAVTINGTNGIVTAKNVKVNDGVFGAPADAKGIPTAAGNTTTINNYGLSVVSKDAGGNVSTIEIKDGKISGLTPGKGDNDAATVGQVNDAIAQSAGNIGRALEKTSQRVNQVGAHAAALAAMNPLSYDPLRKSQIMAGIGTYSGNKALALGVAHYANENFMFNVGVTMGEGKSMANVGATYRFGTGDDDNIPERYKGGPISSVYVMQDEISALKAENARKDVEYGNKIDMLMERIAMLEAKLK